MAAVDSLRAAKMKFISSDFRTEKTLSQGNEKESGALRDDGPPQQTRTKEDTCGGATSTSNYTERASMLLSALASGTPHRHSRTEDEESESHSAEELLSVVKTLRSEVLSLTRALTDAFGRQAFADLLPPLLIGETEGASASLLLSEYSRQAEVQNEQQLECQRREAVDSSVQLLAQLNQYRAIEKLAAAGPSNGGGGPSQARRHLDVQEPFCINRGRLHIEQIQAQIMLCYVMQAAQLYETSSNQNSVGGGGVCGAKEVSTRKEEMREDVHLVRDGGPGLDHVMGVATETVNHSPSSPYDIQPIHTTQRSHLITSEVPLLGISRGKSTGTTRTSQCSSVSGKATGSEKSNRLSAAAQSATHLQTTIVTAAAFESGIHTNNNNNDAYHSAHQLGKQRSTALLQASSSPHVEQSQQPQQQQRQKHSAANHSSSSDGSVVTDNKRRRSPAEVVGPSVQGRGVQQTLERQNVQEEPSRPTETVVAVVTRNDVAQHAASPAAMTDLTGQSSIFTPTHLGVAPQDISQGDEATTARINNNNKAAATTDESELKNDTGRTETMTMRTLGSNLQTTNALMQSPHNVPGSASQPLSTDPPPPTTNNVAASSSIVASYKGKPTVGWADPSPVVAASGKAKKKRGTSLFPCISSSDD